MKKENTIFLILHNIRSLHNVGSIFRTADGAGVEKMYLTGYTPSPVDIFGKTRKEIAKTALGAEKTISWEKYKNLGSLISKLKKEGFEVVAVEQDEGSVDYKKYKTPSRVVFIFGNEVRGVSKQTLKKCDAIIEIPMKGKKESLNVSVSAGIVLFSLLD